jgi:hypothetical protein
MGLTPETGQAFENFFFKGCEWSICLPPPSIFVFLIRRRVTAAGVKIIPRADFGRSPMKKPNLFNGH